MLDHVGARQYARYGSVITASGYASGMNRSCIAHESCMHRGMHRGTRQVWYASGTHRGTRHRGTIVRGVIALSVKLGGGVLALAHVGV